MAVKGFFAKLKNLFSFTELDDDFFDELEELLILSDVGMTMTEEIMDKLHKVVQNEIIRTNDDLQRVIGGYAPGTRVDVTVMRTDRGVYSAIDVFVELGARTD